MISKARFPIFRCLVLPKSNFSKCTTISRSSVPLSTKSTDDNTLDENIDVDKPDNLLSKLNKSPKKSKKSVIRETSKTLNDEGSKELFSKLTSVKKKSNPDRQKRNITKSEEIKSVNDNNVEDLFSRLTGNAHPMIKSSKEIIKSEAKEVKEPKKKEDVSDQDSDSLVSRLVNSTFQAKPPRPRKHTRPSNKIMKDSITGIGLKRYLSYDDESPAIMACLDVNHIMEEDDPKPGQKDYENTDHSVQDNRGSKIAKSSGNNTKIEKQAQEDKSPEPKDLSNLLTSLSKSSKNKRSSLESMITEMNVVEDHVEEDFKAPTDNHEVHPELLMDHEMPVTNLRILDQLTPQLRMDLTNGVTVRKFRLKKLESWMKELREKGYPLPESLDKSQWDQILKYDGNRVTFYYLEAVWDQRDKDEQLLQHLAKMDKSTYSPLNYNSEDLEDLIGDDPELHELWETIENEFEQLQMEGEDLWPHYNRLKLKLLLECSCDEERFRSYKFFTTKALSDVWDKVKNRQSKIACIKRLVKRNDLHKSKAIDYTNTFVGNIYEGVISSDYYHWREAMEDWNEPMVFDLSHWTALRESEKSRLTGHLYQAINYVNAHPQPIQTYFTGFDPKIMQSLHYDCQTSIHGLRPETWTEKSYMDLFPREKLLYLTSDSPNILEYSPDDIYVIGASSNFATRNTSLNFARKNNIRHAKFPMSETIGLDIDVPLYTCALVLMDYRRSRDWFYAFRWLYPSYFLRVLAYSKTYTYKQEYTYLTHRKLHPEHIQSYLGMMTPQEYRSEYERYMSYAPKSDLEVMSNKYNHELSMFKSIPRHVNNQKYLIE